jgi:PAS domain S-box-containing protein
LLRRRIATGGYGIFDPDRFLPNPAVKPVPARIMFNTSHRREWMLSAKKMIRVLFVDGEEAQLALGKRCLEKSGEFTIDTTRSAAEAFKPENLLRYDAIVSGDHMPGPGSIEFLQQIRGSGNTIPFILFTGRGQEEKVIQALNEGADFCVPKEGQNNAQYAELGHRIKVAVQRQKDRRTVQASEQALRESEERYHSLADAAEDLIYIIDKNDIVVYVNRFGLSMLKKNSAGVVGKLRRDLFPDAVAARQYQSIRQVFTSGKPLRIVSKIPLPGQETWQDTQLVPLKSESGIITAVMGISRDITENRNTEDALRDNLLRYHLILKNAQEGILVNELTPEGPGKFLEANDSACRILGLTREEMQNTRLADLDSPEMKKRYPEIIAELQQNHHALFQINHTTRDNNEKNIEISVSVFELGGRPTLLSVIRDITGQMRAEQALRHANKKLGLLTSITRHDIRNQLLSLNSYLLLSRATLGDAKKTAEFIRKEEEITRTIDRQILFTREYENIGADAPVWQNVEQCIGRAVGELDLTSIRLDIHGIRRLEIVADSLLQKVFFNLIDNSLRHGDNGLTQIRFLYRETENGLVIHCEDDGSGIPADEKEMIFERGYGKNTGFGLFFIREILAITGITIHESGETGKGARFVITVPKGEYRFTSGQDVIPAV